ncbi:MAG: 3-oxoacyl-ACP reductase family protein, partial [Planctomycetota bacterium]
MDLGLKGKTALVTGGSRGIGAAIAQRLAQEGCAVAFTHLGDADGAAATATAIEQLGGTALAFESDVSDTQAAQAVVEEIVAEHKGIDILVCNAGITDDAVSWKMNEEQWDRVLDVNLKGCFNFGRAVVPHFRKSQRGAIVNVSSINGLRGKFGQVNYAASKGGMIALTKTLAKELGAFGVTVNAVAPGMVLTEMIKTIPEEKRAAGVAETVLGKIAEPADIADAVAFLVSDRARHITGTVLRVDGGQ